LLTPYIKYFTVPHKLPDTSRTKALPFNKAVTAMPPDRQMSNALNEAQSMRESLRGIAERYREESKGIRKYSIEYQKKFTLSAACLALFLIGAPLGAIIRKGGLGLPVVVSVIFFLIYYIIATIGEKSVKEGSMSPFVGMWMAIGILTPIGIFLSYKAANDSVLFDAEAYKRFLNKIFKSKKPNQALTR
jgi:lipopolysaccharide export system permease protein